MNNYPLQKTHMNDARNPYANSNSRQPKELGFPPAVPSSKTQSIPYPFPLNMSSVSGPSPTRPCTPQREEAPLALFNDASAPHAIPSSRRPEPTGLLPALILTPSAFTESAKRKPSDSVDYPSKKRTVSGPNLTQPCTPSPSASSSAAVVGGRSPAVLVNESPRLLRQAKIKAVKQRSCSAPIRPCTPPPFASAGTSSPVSLVTESPRMVRKGKINAAKLRSSRSSTPSPSTISNRPSKQPSPHKGLLNRYNWVGGEHAPQDRVNRVTYGYVRLPQTPTKKRTPSEFMDEGIYKIKDEDM